MFTQFIYILSYIDKSNMPGSFAFYSLSEALDYADKHEIPEVHVKRFKLILNNNRKPSNIDEKVSA